MPEGCAQGSAGRAGMAAHTLDGQVLVGTGVVVGTVSEAGRPRWGHGGQESARRQRQQEKCVSCAQSVLCSAWPARPALFSLVKGQEPLWPRSPARTRRRWTRPRRWLLSARWDSGISQGPRPRPAQAATCPCPEPGLAVAQVTMET